MTQRQYIEYLIATSVNYTCTNLAEHLEGEAAQSHDAISDFLRRAKLTPRGLWDVVEGLLQDGPESFLVFDDSVQDKRYSTQIELVKLQYSGAEGQWSRRRFGARHWRSQLAPQHRPGG